MTTEYKQEGIERWPIGAQLISYPADAEPTGDGPAALVEQMVASGEWPRPELLKQILDGGEASVGPLQDVVKTRRRGWPAEAPLCHAAGLLSMLGPASAIPLLAEAARFYKGDTVQSIGDAIACLGAPGLDALIELVQEADVSGYQRSYLIHKAKEAAGNDEGQRARLGEVLRKLFIREMTEIHADREFELELLGAERDEGQEDLQRDVDLHGLPIEEVDEEQFEKLLEENDGRIELDDDRSEELSELAQQEELDNEISRDEDLAFLTLDLADLADPLARDMIEAAFDAGQIDESIVDRKDVDRLYRSGGEKFSLRAPWLEEYQEFYTRHLKQEEERRSRPRRDELPDIAPAAWETAHREPPPRIEPVEPIRNAAPKIGRNDPCWCGSGKKFKKCHLGQGSAD